VSDEKNVSTFKELEKHLGHSDLFLKRTKIDEIELMCRAKAHNGKDTYVLTIKDIVDVPKLKE